MSNTDGAAPAAAPSTGELSINEAVNYLNNPPKDREQDKSELPPPPPEPRVAREKSTPDGVDDAAADEDQPPGEPDENEAADEDLPPLKPHKALTAAEREVFESLPRLAQEAWNQRERDRDTFYRKGHDEAAATIRTAQERERAAEQARVNYEAALPQLLQEFSAQFQEAFQDIKTWDDVSEMQRTNPMRFQEWQVAQAKGQSLQKQTLEAQQRQQQQYWQRFAQWSEAEDTKSEEYLKKEHPKLGPMDAVGKGLRQMLIDDVGFTDDEVTGWWAGQPMSLRDSRVQRVFIDHYAYRKAKAAAKEIPAKPVPPVQRPGTASNRGEAGNVTLKILSDRLSKTGKIEDAVAYQNAKSALARRRG